MASCDENGVASAPRWVTVDGHTNFRDIGGYQTVHGRRVRFGLLYRSDAGRDTWIAEAAAALGLATIFDLRTTDECLAAGASHVQESALPRRLHVPLFEAIPSHWSRPTDLTTGAIADRYLEMLDAGVHQLAAIVEHLASEESLPAVIHCVAGRDRTGIVVACLLSLVGVPDDVVADDYALSPPVQLTPEQATSVGAEELVVDRSVALQFLARIRRRYGSLARLVQKEGITHEQLAQLNERLLIRA
jgi:protein-tyrosine phosphatase